MLLMMLEKGEQIDDVVFFDWGMEFPQMYEHLEKLEAYIKRPITRLYPLHSFDFYQNEYVLVKGKRRGQVGYGLPHAKARWCTGIKRDVIKKYVGRHTVQCIGYCFQERRRATYPDHHRYPLLEWGVHSVVALEYCKSKGFDWGGLYKIYPRVSCMCCPFSRKYKGNKVILIPKSKGFIESVLSEGNE